MSDEKKPELRWCRCGELLEDWWHEDGRCDECWFAYRWRDRTDPNLHGKIDPKWQLVDYDGLVDYDEYR